MPEISPHRHLLILSPPGGKPLQFELKGKRVGLGRSSDNHICVDFGQISASHLEFELVGANYAIRDLQSTNGVTVNGERVTDPRPIKDGDRLMIGRTIPAHYLVVAAGEKATAAATFSSKEEQDQAAAFTSMDEKIHKLEGEAHQLEAQIARLKSDYDRTKAEHDKALGLMKSAEERLREKENAGAADAELDALQTELLEQTRRFKILASDLDGQKQQIEKLQGVPQPALPAQPPRHSSPQAAGPAKPLFASPAPIPSSAPFATPVPAPASNLPLAAPSPATSPPIQIAGSPPSPLSPSTGTAQIDPAPAPAAAALVATPQPARIPQANPTPQGGATLQIPGGSGLNKAKLQLSGDPKAPPKPTMKLGADASAPKRLGLNVPKKPPGDGPKTVKLS